MRDVPDVLGLADFAQRPDLTLRLVHERILADTLFVDHKRFPLPKPSGGTRGLTVMSPIAELALRVYVGRCSGAVRAAVDEDHVLNGLIRRPGPGWFSADFREQHRLRRELQRHYYYADETRAVGFLDTQKFFPSCRHDWLGARLRRLGAPLGATEVLVAILSSLFGSGVGLPIGFEGSGPLANLFLCPLDEALRNEGLEFVRWTDDVDVFLPSADAGPDLMQLGWDKHAEADLRMNDSKSIVLEKGDEAERRLLDPSRDSVLGGDAVDNVRSRLDVQLWMNEWGMPDDLPPAHFRSFLGILRKDRDAGALEYLAEFPAWVDREPRAVGDYLSALADYPDARSRLDVSWLVGLAVGRRPTAQTEAGQLHLCRALARFRLSSEPATRLLDFAMRSDVCMGHPVLGAWAVRAWSASRGWNKTDALNVIDAVAHNDYRRAAAIGFAHRPLANTEALNIRARAEPELAPAIALALAA